MGTRIKDIARKANVSLATVSLVLNDKGNIGQQTRERVLRVAQEMQYEKSNARNPNHNRNELNTIAFVKMARHGHTVNRDHNVFIADYIDGITEEAQQHNEKVEVISFEPGSFEEVVATLRGATDLAGAVVLGTELSRTDVIAIGQTGMPLVFLDTVIDFLRFDFVDMNNEDSVFSAIEHFTVRGHRDIGMVYSSVQTRNFQLRRSAFEHAMSFLDLPIQERFVFDCDSTFAGAHHDMRRFLTRGRKLPTALFCTNDIMAFGVMRAIQEAGYRVPEDVSIIGFDDLPAAAQMDPPLTTISVSKREIGRTAISRLRDRIQSPEKPVAKIVIGGDLIERHSVKQIS